MLWYRDGGPRPGRSSSSRSFKVYPLPEGNLPWAGELFPPETTPPFPSLGNRADFSLPSYCLQGRLLSHFHLPPVTIIRRGLISLWLYKEVRKEVVVRRGQIRWVGRVFQTFKKWRSANFWRVTVALWGSVLSWRNKIPFESQRLISTPTYISLFTASTGLDRVLFSSPSLQPAWPIPRPTHFDTENDGCILWNASELLYQTIRYHIPEDRTHLPAVRISNPTVPSSSSPPQSERSNFTPVQNKG
jgi:hypothetical protein